MSVIKNVIGTVKKNLKSREQKKKRAETKLNKLRAQSEPVLRRVAKEFGATVEILSKNAYISKTIKNQERGAYIEFGTPPDEIRRILTRKFTGSTAVHKLKTAAKTVKQVRDELRSAGILSSQSMWGDPKNIYGKR